MKKLTITFLLSAVALRLAIAADAPADANGAEAAAPENSPAIELKKKSSFAGEESGRNPFWPIGWKPAVKQANAVEQSGPEISPNAFLVSSITVDTGGRFAIINGKAMTEGQVFGLQLGNQTYQLTVKAIQDGQVVLLRRDQEIVVPLRRR